MPLQATSGAASQDAFGGNGVAVVPNYIEEVFSTYLYTGTGATTQTITNGIDLSTKGGMVWGRPRDVSSDFSVFDSIRGSDWLRTNSIGVQNSNTGFSMLTTGFSMANMSTSSMNFNGSACVSWTFRKQPKFFDVVSWTGNSANRTISHSLGSVPACIIVKRTDVNSAWQVYHRSLANTEYLVLNSTAAAATGATRWNSTTPTSSVFSLGTDASVNASAGTYVAYLFAHDAGGFGLTGTDNVISCGSVVGASQVEVNLGYEPQWILVKNASSAQDWWLVDNMRGLPVQDTSSAYNASNLRPNLSDAETTGFSIAPSATGFKANVLTASQTYIYIAIRRGPMKVPTLGTSVFSTTSTSTDTGTITSNFPTDMVLSLDRTAGQAAFNRMLQDRLRGDFKILDTSTTNAENSNSSSVSFNSNTGIVLNGGGVYSNGFVHEQFRRAPSFFDEVCYTGTGSALTVSHNLAAVPELIIGKNRTTVGNNWPVLFNFASTTMNYGFLNLTNSCPNDTYANVGVFSAAPTSTSMFLISSGSMNTSTNNHVAYLFATCAGVSKVFSYTGNGSSQTINCGFTAGSRFVMIKRTDSTGDWYVWDTARGIIAGNDPHLSLNTTAAEVTTDDTIDTDNTGFVVNQLSATNVNVTSATYIGLAVA